MICVSPQENLVPEAPSQFSFSPDSAEQLVRYELTSLALLTERRDDMTALLIRATSENQEPLKKAQNFDSEKAARHE